MAYGGVRRRTAAYGGVRRRTAAYGGVRRRTAAYGGVRRRTAAYGGVRRRTAAYGGVRRRTAAYGVQRIYSVPLEPSGRALTPLAYRLCGIDVDVSPGFVFVAFKVQIERRFTYNIGIIFI